MYISEIKRNRILNQKSLPTITRRHFKRLINKLVEINYSTIYYVSKNKYERMLNIATTIIKKYDKEDSWYLKKYLEIFFWGSRYINENNNRYPIELMQIINVLQKCKLSNIINLYIKKIQFVPKKINGNIYDWLDDKENNNLVFTKMLGISILFKYLIKDIKIPNTFELCTTGMLQLLYIIYHYKGHVQNIIVFS